MVVARGIARACETGKVDEGCASDVVGYRFEGELEGMAEKSVVLLASSSWFERPREDAREISCGLLVFCLLFCEESSKGDDICVDLLLLNSMSVGSHDECLILESLEN